MSARRAQGFTLIELIIAISISAIVVVFASMFISAPIGAYEAHSRRAALVTDAAGVWPRMQEDLRKALPNSVRARRNGNYVVLEMLSTEGYARYRATPAASFPVSGAAAGIFGTYAAGATVNGYLSVNNLGTPGADAYAQTGSMTGPVTVQLAATATPGVVTANVNPAPGFSADSPRHKIYFVSTPVAYLCDETAGTLRRYSNYAVVANQALRDAPADFAGAANALVAQGLGTCNFAASAFSPTQAQTVSVRITSTRSGESVTLLHSSRAEYIP